VKLTPAIICKIEQALALVEFGEVVLLVHRGKLAGIDVKNRQRIPVDKSVRDDIDSR